MREEELRRRRSSIPKVEWLGFDHDSARVYERGSIQEYLLRRGWTATEISDLKQGQLPGRRSVEASLAMLQSWMTLGLMECFFAQPFSSSLFVSELGKKKIFSTEHLRDYIDDWQNHSMPSFPHLVTPTYEGCITDSLDEAVSWNNLLVPAQHMYKERSLYSDRSLFDSVMRLTTLVGEALQALAERFPASQERFALRYEWFITVGNQERLHAQLKSQGWCPSIYRVLTKGLHMPSSLVEYASIVDPADMHLRMHERCSTHDCIGHNVDNKTYKTRHIFEGCQCKPFLFPSFSKTQAILLDDDVPLINGNVLLRSSLAEGSVCRASLGLPYVTFSHIWSDGLGSCTEDGLPQCQVQALYNMAMEVGKTPRFWIDSLCIPRDSQARRRAISQMAKTYRHAHATIVLDDRIKQCSTGNSKEEIMLHLASSVWQRRLWTLQEGALSRNMHFKLADSFLQDGKLLDGVGSEVYRPVIRNCVSHLDNITAWALQGDVTIGALQRNISHRQSSKLDDESLAMASLLNLNVSYLPEVDGEERMMRFWSKVPSIPRDIIILGGAKIKQEPFRWAPRSLISKDDEGSIDKRDESGRTTPRGLLATWYIYSLGKRLPVNLADDQLHVYNAQTGAVLTVYPDQGSTVKPFHCHVDAILCLDKLPVGDRTTAGVVLSFVEKPGHPKIYKYEKVSEVCLHDDEPEHIIRLLQEKQLAVTGAVEEVIIS